MASQEFTVLYTHQKMKKSKTWQDGILRVRTGRNQATLFDDKGQCLESIFIKSQVTPGDDLESERYLITVEAAKVSEKPSEERPKQAETPAVDRNGVKPALLPPRHLPVGLKRKFTGFRGPRQVEKKTPAVEDEGKAAVLPSSKGCQGSFPSQFYISSPLFSTVCRKDAGTNPSAGSQEEGCRDKGREQMSVSCLLSAPFSDSWEGTERQNSHQVAGKQESPLLPGHTGAGAVSHHIRSTAQIIALLKSKPAQGHHREQTFGATGCLSRVQAAQNAGLCDRKSPVLPAPSGDPAKGLVPDTQHLPFVQGNVKDTKDWNVLALANSAEQPCGEEVTGHRQDKKPNCVDSLLQKTDAYIVPIAAAQRDPGPSDWQPKSPGSRSLHEDDVDIVGEGNFQVKPDVIEETGINQCSLALDVHPEVPPWTVSHPPPDPRQAQWTAWEPGKVGIDWLLQTFLALFPVCSWQFLTFGAVLSQL
uniref:5'-3' DNA helicase ZGRF1-like N-terminal domain-containing protein n=1 Tax=Zonotrichia albicollis TaxID=44394 RepID=A0A8D2QC14_ZONAL